MMMTHGQEPNTKSVPPGQKNAILNARMTIGETDLMGTDVSLGRFRPMRSACLSLSVNSVDQAERPFALLSDGAQIYADRGNVLRVPLGYAGLQVRNLLDDHQRTRSSTERLASVFAMLFGSENGTFPL